MESICAGCGTKIIEMEVDATIIWMHIHKSADGFVDEMYNYCRYIHAKPILMLMRTIMDENIKTFVKETKLSNSVLKRNRYSTVPPYEWYGPNPEPNDIEWDFEVNLPLYTSDYLRMNKEKK